MTEVVADWGETPDELAERIYHMRKIGQSFADIRRSLGHDGVDLSVAQIAYLYRTFTTSMAEAWGVDERAHARFLELERLDALQASIWSLAATHGDVKAIETVLKVMAQRHKLLGLDMGVASEKGVVNQVLIVGDDKKAFIDALINGRDSGTLTGPVEDTEDEEDDDD